MSLDLITRQFRNKRCLFLLRGSSRLRDTYTRVALFSKFSNNTGNTRLSSLFSTWFKFTSNLLTGLPRTGKTTAYRRYRFGKKWMRATSSTISRMIFVIAVVKVVLYKGPIRPFIGWFENTSVKMHCAGVPRGSIYTTRTVSRITVGNSPHSVNFRWDLASWGRCRIDRKLPGNLLMHSGINLTSLEPRQLLLTDVVKHIVT